MKHVFNYDEWYPVPRYEGTSEDEGIDDDLLPPAYGEVLNEAADAFRAMWQTLEGAQEMQRRRDAERAGE